MMQWPITGRISSVISTCPHSSCLATSLNSTWTAKVKTDLGDHAVILYPSKANIISTFVSCILSLITSWILYHSNYPPINDKKTILQTNVAFLDLNLTQSTDKTMPLNYGRIYRLQ